MARKNILSYEVAVGQSLAANFTSPVTQIPYLDNIAYQIDITTTDSIGTFSVQGSLDYAQMNGVVTNAGHWVTLPLSGTPFAAGSNDDIMIDMNQLPFSALRLVYTSSVAGTGHCDIHLLAKQLGG